MSYEDEDGGLNTDIDGLTILKRWQEKGYEVALTTSIDGVWHVAIGSAGYFMRPAPSVLDPQTPEQFYYISPPCDSPESAIAAALTVIQL